MNRIYLDYNSTAPVKPAVIETITKILKHEGNPSSVHSFGRDVKESMEEARDLIATMVSGRSEGVIFTSGGTESNNLALTAARRRRLLVSAIEHPSILTSAKAMEYHCDILPVDKDGVVSPSTLISALENGGSDTLVSIMLANNETGTVQPVAELSKICHDAGAIFHCDAVQAPGRISININLLGVDMLSISGHKFGGPKGVGALIMPIDYSVSPTIIGGGQERGWRGGTENIPGIVGMGHAAKLALEDLGNADMLAKLRNYLEEEILELCPEVKVFGSSVNRLPNTSCLSMPGVQSETQVMAFDLAGIAVSAGSACSSGKVEPSHVLKAMGIDDAFGGCAIRVSLGWGTKPDDIKRFIKVWRATYAGLSSRYKKSLYKK